MARRPDEFRAFFNYHDVLMDQSNSSLTKAEKELIVVATSALNDCHYCVIAHGAILRIRAKNPLIADQVSINFRKADLTERESALLEFAAKIATSGQDRGSGPLGHEATGFFGRGCLGRHGSDRVLCDEQSLGKYGRGKTERRFLHDGARVSELLVT